MSSSFYFTALQLNFCNSGFVASFVGNHVMSVPILINILWLEIASNWIKNVCLWDNNIHFLQKIPIWITIVDARFDPTNCWCIIRAFCPCSPITSIVYPCWHWAMQKFCSRFTNSFYIRWPNVVCAYKIWTLDCSSFYFALIFK